MTWDDVGWTVAPADLPGVEPGDVIWPDRETRQQVPPATRSELIRPEAPEPDQMWTDLIALAVRAAADQRMIEKLGQLLANNPDRQHGYLIYRDWYGENVQWVITQSPFIDRDKVYLIDPDGPDLMVHQQEDGLFQGYRQKPKDGQP